MQKPVQLNWRHLKPSQAVAERVLAWAARLERFDHRLTGCTVTLEDTTGQHHRQAGSQYRVRIELSVPGTRLVVARDPRPTRAHADLYAAVNAAFREARRQLQDYARRAHQQVKTHAPAARAVVARLFPEDGYGFLRTPDEREVYFHERSVLNGGFSRLVVGAAVSFVEEPGDEGPQASTVVPAGRRAAPAAAGPA